ncbi:MAG TPA: dehydrogenase, partial [Nitrososphaera sp.]|nr:dehydrogenase [Nitrososphaera sp.]
KTVLDREFVSLALSEVKSSLSKRAMIARAREFLPALHASAFTKRGTSGIRSSVVDSRGRFLPDTLVHWAGSSVHVLNYNSPGATGALPMAAKVAARILKLGMLAAAASSRSLWDAASIADRMEE